MASRDHYHKYFEGEIDVYRICRLYNIDDPAIYHAIKKLLRFGDTNKSPEEDVEGAILALERWLTMEDEDKNGSHTTSEDHMKEDLDQYFDQFVEDKADEVKDKIERRLHCDDLSEEEKRDLVYDLLLNMEGREEFIKDNFEREIWDINWLSNHAPESQLDKVIKRARNLSNPLNYRIFRTLQEMSEISIQALLERVHSLDRDKVQILINKAKESDEVDAYPFFTGLERRKTQEWLRFLGESGRRKVKAIIDEIESQD